jgi:hypothetical protein
MALRFRYAPWRALYQHLVEYRGDAWADDVLLPWVEAHPRPVRDLRRIGQPEAMNVAVPNDHDNYTPLQALYVLSRVLDVLIAPFQPDRSHGVIPEAPSGAPPGSASPPGSPPAAEPWPGRLPDQGAYEAFCSALGCAKVSQELFHPFFHEIAAVQLAEDPQEPPSLVTEQWPGYLAGSLLLTRAGVTVRAGSRWLDPAVAERSPLYWAWWRRGRTAVDESRGWGPNSQWRTDFRRDYYVSGQAYYNVDAAFRAPRHLPGELTITEQRDLLRYRCGTLADPGPGLWMWDVSHAESIQPLG